jgi:hypothetical protein
MDRMSTRVIIGGLLLVGVASVGVSLKTSHDTGKTNDCLVNYIAESARISKVRSAATMKREQAVTDVLDGVAKLALADRSDDPEKAQRQAKKSAADYRELLANYRRTAAEVAAERLRNPLPDLPEKCPDA